jgi:thiol:disulfide interchange protein
MKMEVLMYRRATAWNRRGVLALVVACSLPLVVAARAHAGGDWNDGGVKWQGYEEGLATAKKENKPVCLVFYTDWCPHCTNYSKVFHDPKVVEKSKQFVMIRLNKDQNAAVSTKYTPDGEYIPRTYFLNAKGELQPDIHEQRDNFKYFYSESDPAGVLRGMDEALKKLGAKS